jgi:hypothetical protein
MKYLTSTAASSIAIALVSAGCASMDTPNKSNYERVLGEAQAAFDKSAMMKHAWSTADDALTDAKKAADAGDWATAINLAKKAREHSELAQAQAMSEANADVKYME